MYVGMMLRLKNNHGDVFIVITKRIGINSTELCLKISMLSISRLFFSRLLSPPR